MPAIIQYRDHDLFFHHSIDPQPDPVLFKMHTHDCCEIYLFLKGKGVFHIEGSAYSLHSGDLLLMRQAEAHYIEVDPQQPYERSAIHFREELLRSFDAKGTLLSPFLAREAGKGNLFRAGDFGSGAYRLFWENMARESRDPRLQLLTNLLPLLYELYHTTEKRTPDAASDGTTAYQIVRYLNAHLYEPLSLENICKQFFISKPQLCRIFKRATGSTVWEYITVKRLMEARQLISSGMPAAAAAAHCGFQEYSSFYRAYRKHFGIPPRQQRSAP